MKTSTNFLPALLAATAAVAWPTTSHAQVFTPPAAPHATLHAEASPAPAAHHPGAPFLGVVTERISEELRHQLPNLKPGVGLIVRELVAHSPAAQMNVEECDILLQWNDQLLVHPAQLQVLVASAQPGDQVTMEFLHRGIWTKSQITLAARPGHHPQPQPSPQTHRTVQPAHPLVLPPAQAQVQPTPHAAPPALPPALLGALQDPEFMKQAAAAIAQSGIDPAMIAGALEGLDLKHIDLGALAKEAVGASKIVIISPDGKRQELPLAGALKDGAKLDQIIKNLDLGKIDPTALLGSKILVLAPDGSTLKEFSPAELLKDSTAINQLLQGLTPPTVP